MAPRVDFGSGGPRPVANFALVHAALRGPRIVPTPRPVVDRARDGYLSTEEARALVETMGPRRSWAGSPSVERLLDLLG